LPDLEEWDGGSRAGEGSPETVGGSLRLHRGEGGFHGFVAGGYGAVEVVVVADEETGGFSGDGSGGRGSVGAGGVVAGFVGHGEGEVGGEGGVSAVMRM